ncbi:unnamed protein product [Clonostachys rosea]|uniref:ABM domain-containing protein n=1 Tax=Bionectria ochroleuca TaxID=29856 RepID=A0ABY6UB11_BIOOC|nr:unnamed protein product [Clonostachys rosea]
MPPVHIIATFFPLPGKVERMRDLLTLQCQAVHEKEDYALRFILTEQLASEAPQFCLFET